jgi:hypothetical protein
VYAPEDELPDAEHDEPVIDANTSLEQVIAADPVLLWALPSADKAVLKERLRAEHADPKAVLGVERQAGLNIDDVTVPYLGSSALEPAPSSRRARLSMASLYNSDK